MDLNRIAFTAIPKELQLLDPPLDTPISQAHRTNMGQAWNMITNDLSVDDIWDQLLQHKGLLTEEDINSLREEENRKQKTARLLTILMNKGERAYYVLLNSLNKYHWHLYNACWYWCLSFYM